VFAATSKNSLAQHLKARLGAYPPHWSSTRVDSSRAIKYKVVMNVADVDKRTSLPQRIKKFYSASPDPLYASFLPKYV